MKTFEKSRVKLHNRAIAICFFLAGFMGIGAPVAILWISYKNLRAPAVHDIQAKARDSTVTLIDDAMYLPTPDNIAQGSALFQKDCTSCHGENADGKSPAASSLTPPPRDFTDPHAKWTLSRKPQDIFKAISGGIDGSAMPGFSASLTQRECWALTHFLGTQPGIEGQFTPIDEKMAQELAKESP